MHLRTPILVAGAALAILAPAAQAHSGLVGSTEPDACSIWAANCLQARGITNNGTLSSTREAGTLHRVTAKHSTRTAERLHEQTACSHGVEDCS